MESIIKTFVDEAQELLDAFEQAALRLESDLSDADAVNELFRAAHTIKGSAGLFGFDAVVTFTHAMETVLDRVRSNEIPVSSTLIVVLLESRDALNGLIRSAVEDDAGGELGPEAQALIGRLEEMSGIAAEPTTEAPVACDPGTPPNACDPAAGVGNDCWHLSLRFSDEVLKDGMDPLAFLRYLEKIGSIERVHALWDDMPALEDMDPELCYLGLELDLESAATKAEIESVFEFLGDQVDLRLIPPRGAIEAYLSLIDDYEGPRLGEILVNIGSLSQRELDDALRRQSEGGAERKLGEVLVESGSADATVVEAALKRQNDMRKRPRGSVRVDADKLDQLINLVGELVIASASATLVARQSSDGAVMEPIENVSGLVEEIRESALRLRVVQIGDTFNRFRRVVHDVSRELGKQIDLQITGADTELDKAVVEKISDPLTHLVRNAIDHGIESTDVRVERGKPAAGTLKLDAYHDSGNVVIEISDDGGGLDLARVRARAIERGLLDSDAEPSEHELAEFIFHPGLSTRDEVTDLSGRGVGMDVVRRNVEALRGTVELHTRAGEGTTARIRLPLTLAIIEGFLVGVGDTSYVVPLDSVSECVELNGAVTCGRERNFINLRGEVLPLMRLRDTLPSSDAHSKRENVLVVHSSGSKAGLVVDRLLGEFQTVIKPLGRLFRNAQGVSGSTVLGDGRVALILDVATLVHHCTAQEAYAVGKRNQQKAIA